MKQLWLEPELDDSPLGNLSNGKFIDCTPQEMTSIFKDLDNLEIIMPDDFFTNNVHLYLQGKRVSPI